MPESPFVDMKQKDKHKRRSDQQEVKSIREVDTNFNQLFSTENPLPEDVDFFRQRTFWGKGWEFLALPFALLGLVLIASLFKSAQWKALVLMIVVECLMLIPLWAIGINHKTPMNISNMHTINLWH